ncbi:protein LHCP TRANSLOCATION DEFECT isoform X2 [Nymphaea colorata]|uniref:protein LHCP TRANSLOCATION DEFECT isoform X2 n=1 Tax=Nymphaea colorata TaxID=210225 RepID=UPI00129D333F|nr:protein LHCP TRANSLOCATION DEFECT isoform X2 [Nymphaea colorata]
MAAHALCVFSPSSSLASAPSPRHKPTSGFLGFRNLGFVKSANFRVIRGPASGYRTKCWFNLGTDAEGAGIYASQKRNDYTADDVDQYYNYMGMLAVEGTYDKLEALLQQNIHPVDILLMMAASEGDKPKIEELLRAGASYTVKNADGKTALDLAVDEEIRELILGFSTVQAS